MPALLVRFYAPAAAAVARTLDVSKGRGFPHMPDAESVFSWYPRSAAPSDVADPPLSKKILLLVL